jgi:hypothetical protein
VAQGNQGILSDDPLSAMISGDMPSLPHARTSEQLGRCLGVLSAAAGTAGYQMWRARAAAPFLIQLVCIHGFLLGWFPGAANQVE